MIALGFTRGGANVSVGRRIRKWGRYPIMAWGMVAGRQSPGIHFLLYHKVSGELGFELDLPFPRFERQMRWLAAGRRVISFDRAVELLAKREPITEDHYVVTFDDGYADFFTHAFPLLRALELPSTLFVATDFVETGSPCVLSHATDEKIAPVTWEMLGRMLESGLLTLGGHTHGHRELPSLSENEIERDFDTAHRLFQTRLGTTPRHFAYPRGRWDERVERIVRKHYVTAAQVGWRKLRSAHFDPYRIVRVPVQKRDHWLSFLAKTHGWLEKESWLDEVSRRYFP